MEILGHLKSRRTVRKFKTDPIPQQTLGTLFEAAMWAPSHANVQPWEFVVVGPQARARLLDVFRVKADELLADPNLPAPKRAGIMALREDFGGAPFMVAGGGPPPAPARRPAADREPPQHRCRSSEPLPCRLGCRDRSGLAVRRGVASSTDDPRDQGRRVGRGAARDGLPS
jgi:nitroreductase